VALSARHLSAWKQQPGESAEAYLAFSIYRDLGPWRSARQAYRKWRAQRPAGAPARPALSGAWKRWHRKWRWQERAFACDREIDRQQCAARQAAKAAYENRRLAYEIDRLKAQRARETRRFELLMLAHKAIHLLERPESFATYTVQAGSGRERRTCIVRAVKPLKKVSRFAALFDQRYFPDPWGPVVRRRPRTQAGLRRITGLVRQAEVEHGKVLLVLGEEATPEQRLAGEVLRELRIGLASLEEEPSRSRAAAKPQAQASAELSAQQREAAAEQAPAARAVEVSAAAGAVLKAAAVGGEEQARVRRRCGPPARRLRSGMPGSSLERPRRCARGRFEGGRQEKPRIFGRHGWGVRRARPVGPTRPFSPLRGPPLGWRFTPLSIRRAKARACAHRAHAPKDY
jgi:hypothetical protein